MTPRLDNLLTDDAVLTELGYRIGRMRIDRDITQADLAREAGVSRDTVVKVEAGQSVQSRNLIRVLRALKLIENLEIAVPQPGPSPIRLVDEAGRTRRRASRRKTS